jgi:two-component system OmpR family response regulator
MPKLLLIDDDIELSEMVSQYLAQEGFVTTTVADGIKGAEQAVLQKYDAIILDVMLPGLSGIEVLKKIRAVSDVPVLMLTAKGSDIDRVVGLELGADDYVPKPYFPRELVARLKAILRRRAKDASAPSLLSLEKLVVSEPNREATWDGQRLDLTATEFNVLTALLKSEDAVATKDSLSLAALGRARESYDRSIDVHVSNLRRKLHVCSGDTLEIETIRGIGYRLKVRR